MSRDSTARSSRNDPFVGDFGSFVNMCRLPNGTGATVTHLALQVAGAHRFVIISFQCKIQERTRRRRFVISDPCVVKIQERTRDAMHVCAVCVDARRKLRPRLADLRRTSTLCTPALRLAYATTAVTAPRMSASEVQRPLSCASDAAPPETAPESSASFSARYRSFDAHLRGGRNECGETQRDRDSAREQEKT